MAAMAGTKRRQAGGTEEKAAMVAPERSADDKKRTAGEATAGKKTASAQNVYLALGHNGQALVEAAMSRLGWTKTTDKAAENWTLGWTETKGMVNYGNFREGQQLVNHIPNCELICNKLGLLTSLREFERVSVSMTSRQLSMQMTDFFPETYVLDYPREREAFLDVFKPGEIWINKPTGLNQGKGIFLIRDPAKFREELQQKEEKKPTGSQTKSGKSMGRIVQRYIMNPLLIHGRKFDIRAYLLIGSTAPYLVLFHHGYLRLSIHKYDADDANLCTHLTNQYIQKKDEKYEEVKNDTVWSMTQFNEYLNSLLDCKEKGEKEETRVLAPPEKDWVFNGMERQMKAILLHMFSAVKHKLTTRLGYFELYGIDFMVDDNYKLFLIEVNTNPAMHVNCQLLSDLLPPLIEQTIHVALECFNKSKKGLQLLPLKSLGSFQVLHCGATAAVQQQPKSSPSKFRQHGSGSPQVSQSSASTKRQQRPNASPTLRRQVTSPNVLPSTGAPSAQQGGSGSAQARRESVLRNSRNGRHSRDSRDSQSGQPSRPVQSQPAKPKTDDQQAVDSRHQQERPDLISSSPGILLSYQPLKIPARREPPTALLSENPKSGVDARPTRRRPMVDRSS